jgi:hypothetical protein
MADNTNDQGTQDQGTQPQAPDGANGTATATNGGADDTTPAKLYPTKAEAEADKPADAPKSVKPYEVFKHGAAVGWMLGRGYDPCLAALARKDGYTVSTGKATAPVTKEAVTAKLADFTDDELLALGLRRKQGRK